MLTETDGSDAPKAIYSYWQGYIDAVAVRMRPNDEYLFVHDNQYSVTSAVNRENREVVERYRYSPYGETTVLTPGFTPKDDSTLENEYTYTGRRLDPSGLMYFRARYYSPQLGQFISRDPLGYVDGMSQYRGYFVPGAVDPTGLSPFSVLAKQIAKQGIKQGLKSFAKKIARQRLKQMTKKEAKEFARELAEILDTLDSSWWEVCLEFVPVAGDLYGGGKLAIKVRKAYDKLQDLENKFVGKISNRLKGDKRKKFLDNKRRQGVRDARRDTDARNRQLGTNDQHRGLEGHHRDNVGSRPDRASDPRNIEFMDRNDHLEAHGGNFRNDTSSGGTNINRN